MARKYYRKYETRICAQCGNEFTSRVDMPNKYCGYQCYWDSLKKDRTRVCPICGKTFNKRGADTFCSVKCQTQDRSNRHRNIYTCENCGREFTRVKTRPAGEKQFCTYKCMLDYNQKSIVNEDGVLVKKETNRKYKHRAIGNGKTKPEHRIVMEEYLGRELLPTEIVHHIDGNKTNNDISNLMIVSKSEHMKIHAKMRANENRERRVSESGNRPLVTM